MSLEDPLEPYRVGPCKDHAELDAQLAKDGHLALEVWTRGGPPTALTRDAFYFVDGGMLYKLRRKDVRGFGMTRAGDTKLMRRGLVSYLLGLPLMFLDPVLAIVAVLVGGYLTTRGFLMQAILVSVKDSRVPPFVVRHRKWRSLRSALRTWEERARSPQE